MNYAYLKKLKCQIKKQKKKIAEIKSKATSISAAVDGMPKSGKVSSRVETSVVTAYLEEQELERLETKLKNIINNIPDEEYRKMIKQKLLDNKSWIWIAVHKSGDNTADSIYNFVKQKPPTRI